jgi:hypothetical protein|tara:strand:+ start:540 stop:1295 length:756 start_codon:yes stop_codon:yes gene_type:complete
MLQYNTCKEGTGQYGVWHRYAVKHNGCDYSLFATDFLHDKLKHYGKGDEISIMKVRANDGKLESRITWDVVPTNGTQAKHLDSPYDEKTTPREAEQVPTKDYWENKDDLTQYRIMKGQSWNLAMQSLGVYPTKAKSWLKGFQEIVKRQEQILLAMTDVFALAKAHLESAGAIPHLANIWRKYEPKWKRELSENEITELMGIAAEVKKKLVAEIEPEQTVEYADTEIEEAEFEETAIKDEIYTVADDTELPF